MKKSFLGVLVLLAGCATAPPSGPGVLVLPGTGKSFDQFRFDDSECRQYAHSQLGRTPEQASNDAGVKSAVVGAALGTVAGAALGGHSGAGVGAGVGLAAGALAGTDAAHASGRTVQQRYDFGYQQCMYAKGHKIPMAREQVRSNPSPQTRYAPPPPPPPPGRPPAGVPPDYRSN